MMRLSRNVETALANAGAVYVRTGKHYIFRLPNGRTVTVSRSASDTRSERNILADIRRQSAYPPYASA